MADNTFPVDWQDEPCYVVAIPKPLIPFVGGLVRIMEHRGFWSTDDDYERGYAAVMQFGGCLMATCLSDMMDLQRAQYRMLNTALFGLEYETVSTDPLIVEPDIAPHVTLDIHNQDSMLGRIDRLTQMFDNRISGAETPLYDDLPGLKQQLQTIIDGLGSDDTDLATIIDNLVLIVGALA